MVEKISELPDFQETYDLYKGRRPDVPEKEVPQEQLEFQDREEAEAKMDEFTAKCAKEFPKLNENSYESETFGKGDFRRTNMKFAEEMLDSTIPLRMVAYKDFVEDRGVKSERIRFCLYKGSEDQLVAVIQGVYQGDKGFDINHRFVAPQYRSQQGIGIMILNSAGSFAKAFATDKQQKVDLFADTAQLDVIYWLWKNNYRPEGDKDWERLDKIVNGDKNLYLDSRYYVFHDSVTGDDRYEKDWNGQVIEENGLKSIDPKKSFRLRMVKSFEPDASAILDDSVRDEIMAVLSQDQNEAISQEALTLLVPQRVYDVAKNPKNVEVRQLRNEEGEISVIVVEKDFPDKLTDPEAYQQWKKDIEVSLHEQEQASTESGIKIKVRPKAPKSVNRLHALFSSDIDEGKLSLSDRILRTCKLRRHHSNPQALYVSSFDGETHQGIGQDFYKNTLPSFARNAGFRFIVGENYGKNFSFFKDTLGRYTIDELKPEFRDTLFPDQVNKQYFTIQFLYPEDVEKYVEKR